jgi:hypothetical protein
MGNLEGEMHARQQAGGLDLSAIAEFAQKDAEYGRRAEELAAITERRNGVRDAHEELRKRRLDEFMSAFMTSSLKLKEMYQMITLGGDAELELVDTLDPFSEVQPPFILPALACSAANLTSASLPSLPVKKLTSRQLSHLSLCYNLQELCTVSAPRLRKWCACCCLLVA